MAYALLQSALVAVSGRDTAFAKAVAGDLRGKLSLAIYLCAIGFAFVSRKLSDLLLATVATIWLVPESALRVGDRPCRQTTIRAKYGKNDSRE